MGDFSIFILSTSSRPTKPIPVQAGRCFSSSLVDGYGDNGAGKLGLQDWYSPLHSSSGDLLADNFILQQFVNSVKSRFYRKYESNYRTLARGFPGLSSFSRFCLWQAVIDIIGVGSYQFVWLKPSNDYDNIYYHIRKVLPLTVYKVRGTIGLQGDSPKSKNQRKDRDSMYQVRRFSTDRSNPDNYQGYMIEEFRDEKNAFKLMRYLVDLKSHDTSPIRIEDFTLPHREGVVSNRLALHYENGHSTSYYITNYYYEDESDNDIKA